MTGTIAVPRIHTVPDGIVRMAACLRKGALSGLLREIAFYALDGDYTSTQEGTVVVADNDPRLLMCVEAMAMVGNGLPAAYDKVTAASSCVTLPQSGEPRNWILVGEDAIGGYFDYMPAPGVVMWFRLCKETGTWLVEIQLRGLDMRQQSIYRIVCEAIDTSTYRTNRDTLAPERLIRLPSWAVEIYAELVNPAAQYM